MMTIKNQIEKEFEALSGTSLVLVETRAENYLDAVMESLAFMLNKGKKGVYVAVSRPSRYIIANMQKRNIKTDDVLFIDCISAMAGEESSWHCTCIETPAKLEEISKQIGSLLERVESNEKFLIVDSFSALLMYNGANSVKDFSIDLIEKLKENKANGIFILIGKGEHSDIKQILTAMCDKVVHV